MQTTIKNTARENARQEIRRNWRALIKGMTSPAKRKVNGETSYICPICGHGKGGDGLTFNPHKQDKEGLKCFGCNFTGDIIDLYQEVNNCDYNTALNALAAQLNIDLQTPPKNDRAGAAQTAEADTSQGVTPIEDKTPQECAEGATEAQPDFTDYYRHCNCGKLTETDHPEALAYLKGRGIDAETAAAFNIGYDAAADPASTPGATGDEFKPHPEPRVIIPCTNSFYIPRAIDPAAEYKAPNPKGSHTQLFNADALYSDSDAVFITEGIFDALAFIVAGQPAIAYHGKGNGALLLKQLEQRPADAAFIICPDNDDAASTMQRAQELEQELKAAGYTAAIHCLPDNQHDANDFLTADREGFLQYIQEALNSLPADDLAAFYNKITTEAYKPYKTGLPFFDELIGGGVIQQSLMLILAAPGTGKTTLCQQIAETMAAAGKPIVYLNFEMSREQMLAKAISARLYHSGHEKTALQILQGYNWTDAERAIMEDAIKSYRATNYQYIKYKPDGITGELTQLLNYLDRLGAEAAASGKPAPAIVVDYLHLITSRAGLETAELIKQIVQGLKDYAMKYNTFVIGIAAANRDSTKTGQLTMESARDSSALEYTADYQITLNYTAVDNKEVDPKNEKELAGLKSSNKRDMILRVVKNRFYQQGRSSRVVFIPAYNTFYGTEPGDDGNPFDDDLQTALHL